MTLLRFCDYIGFMDEGKDQGNGKGNGQDNDIYASWRETQRSKFTAMRERIKDFDSLFRGKILDLGSGPGYLEEFLKEQGIEADIVSVDPEKRYGEGKGNFLVAKAEDLSFEKETFDTIVCIDTLHLIKNKNFLLTLKPNGHFLCSLFFRDDNFEERRRLLHSFAEGLEIIDEFSLQGKEKEHVLLGRKVL